jgi:hypothetical protein
LKVKLAREPRKPGARPSFTVPRFRPLAGRGAFRGAGA